MTPIVNPIFFWLIDTGGNLRIAFGTIAIVFLLAWGITKLVELLEFDYQPKHSITWVLILGIVSGILWALVPSPDTCYKMLAASLITPDNLNSVIGTGKDIVNYIVESATEILSMGG